MSIQKTVFSIVLLGFLMIPLNVFGQQSENNKKLLEQGVAYFSKENYENALKIFNRLLADPSAKTLHGDVLYWTSLSYIAENDWLNASKSIDAFLTSYPKHPYVNDILYQQGRLLFSRAEYEPALRIFIKFLEDAPKHELSPSALFWAAESLFSLGRLEEAEKLYRQLIDIYPKNVKVEAANYRVLLIRYKYREDELLKLLKWSHEETLRLVEEYQRREKTYEQALAMYQRRIGETNQTPSTGDPKLEIDKLNIRIDDLTIALAERDAKIREMTNALKTDEKKDPIITGNGKTTQMDPGKEVLLDLKAKSLELLEFYLKLLIQNYETGGK